MVDPQKGGFTGFSSMAYEDLSVVIIFFDIFLLVEILFNFSALYLLVFVSANFILIPSLFIKPLSSDQLPIFLLFIYSFINLRSVKASLP